MRVSFDTQEAFESEYSLPLGDGERVSYTRFGFQDVIRSRLESIAVNRLWTPSMRVLVVGCGFGWGMESLHNYGIPVWGTDISRYIQENKQYESIIPDRILPHNVATAEGRDGVKSAAGAQPFRIIVTEDVLPCYDDEDAIELVEGARQLLVGSGTMIHIVTSEEEGAVGEDYNVKLLPEWQTLFPRDIVLSVRGEEV